MSLPAFPGGKIPRQTKEGGYRKVVLTAEQEEWLRKWFPTTRGNILREKMGLCLSTFYRIIREMGITKTQNVRARIWRASSKKGVETCKKNGYYNSLKGSKPSPQCIEATHRFWQDVRDGKRLHPIAQLKKNHPRKYAERSAKIGEQRKKLFRMEKFRLISGMPQETKLRIEHYTRSQTSHRHNALKRGYWYYEDCSTKGGERWNIYWDKDTQRSATFENNLRKDGFNVLDGTNL